jgi:hypothetical protein
VLLELARDPLEIVVRVHESRLTAGAWGETRVRCSGGRGGRT